MNVQKVERWGRSLAVRVPRQVAASAGLGEGQVVELIVHDGEIVIRPRRPSALEELFAGRSAEEWRALYRGTDSWGADVGREIVEE